MAEKCDACNGRLEEDFISDYLTMSVDQRPCALCRGTGVIRTGPYRLADGTWSDGVDRTYMIPSHRFSKANPDRVYVHTTYDRETLGKWQPLFDVWQGDAMLECELSFDEAIAYAERMARTNQGEKQ